MYLNLLNSLKLNYIAKKKILVINYSKTNKNLLILLVKLGYIQYYYFFDKKIIIYLFSNINKNLKILYTSSNFKYIKYTVLRKKLNNNLNLNFVLSTKRGLMSSVDALKYKIGGKLICLIF